MTADEVTEKLPIYSMESFAPAKRKDYPELGQANGTKMDGAVFWPNGGYFTDPALSAQNLMTAAERHGAEVRTGADVTGILKDNGRGAGARLADGTDLRAAVVINVAGPGSSPINDMAGVLDDVTISTRLLRQEVVHVPTPGGFNLEDQGTIVSDSDITCYVRLEHGNHILIGRRIRNAIRMTGPRMTETTIAISPINGQLKRCVTRNGHQTLGSPARQDQNRAATDDQ